MGVLMDKHLARFESHKKECGEARERVNCRAQEKEALDEKELVGYLKDLGATRIQSNGYAFRFEYADKGWRFVNQTDRICISLVPAGKEYLFMSSGYDNHIINGKPLKALREAIDKYAYVCPCCDKQVD